MSRVSSTKCYTLQIDDKGKLRLINNHGKILKECNAKEFTDNYNDQLSLAKGGLLSEHVPR